MGIIAQRQLLRELKKLRREGKASPEQRKLLAKMLREQSSPAELVDDLASELANAEHEDDLGEDDLDVEFERPRVMGFYPGDRRPGIIRG